MNSEYFRLIIRLFKIFLDYTLESIIIFNVLSMCYNQVEFILMGGTFMSLPAEYRDYFTRNLHDALSGHTSANVEEAVAYSEHSAIKCIGMTIET